MTITVSVSTYVDEKPVTKTASLEFDPWDELDPSLPEDSGLSIEKIIREKASALIGALENSDAQ